MYLLILQMYLRWKLCRCAGSNMIHHKMHSSQPTLPRSNRQYVPPLMLAKGRGKKLKELHSSRTQVAPKSYISIGSNLGEKSPVRVDVGVLKFKKVGINPNGLDDDDRNGDDDFYSSPEDEDMKIDESSENHNGLDDEDVNDNILENAYRNSSDNDHEDDDDDDDVDKNVHDNECEDVDHENRTENSFEKHATSLSQQVTNGNSL